MILICKQLLLANANDYYPCLQMILSTTKKVHLMLI